jgi:alpha-N-arabinofuranosidase
MKRAFPFALGLVFATALYGQITINDPIPQTATVNVNASEVGSEMIPRTIFGTFLEPIGNSTYRFAMP